MGHVNGGKRSIQYLEHEVQRVCKNWASDPSRGLVYCNGERHCKPQPTEVEGSSQKRQGKLIIREENGMNSLYDLPLPWNI